MESKEKIILYENILASMNDGLIAISSDGQMFMINPAAEKILEYSKDQLLGKGWGEVFFLQGGNEEFNQVILDVIYERKIKYSKIVPYCSPSGKKKILAMNSSYLRDMGMPDRPLIGMIVLFYDITEFFRLQQSEKELLIKARELTLAKAEALRKLAQGVAHEIRNPVTAIGGFAARLLKEHPEIKYLEEILRNAKRLENIVAQVSEFTNLPPPRKREVEIRAVIESMLDKYYHEAKERGVELRLVEGNIVGGKKVLLDPDLFKSAMEVIMENSMESMDEGGFLEIGFFIEGDELVIRVKDTGRGIPGEDLPFIFDPFFSTKANGVGMNLAKAREIISEHGGRIEVESKAGHGTTFEVRLPTQ